MVTLFYVYFLRKHKLNL